MIVKSSIDEVSKRTVLPRNNLEIIRVLQGALIQTVLKLTQVNK